MIIFINKKREEQRQIYNIEEPINKIDILLIIGNWKKSGCKR